MAKELVMGNQAIAYGAVKAGVNLVAGYPGTPSTEVLETIAKSNTGDIYVEWSVNEKAAMEVAAGAAYSGARVLVTMKQVGLNVASDPFMCVNYVGIKGGMVVLVADDPGPISSQTEQDTRRFAQFAKVQVLDPSSPQEAYEMVQEAFELSEQTGRPVILRPTTRVCHGYQTIDLSGERRIHEVEGFVKDSSKWVIFPRASYQNHIALEKMLVEQAEAFTSSRFNRLTGQGTKGICAGGVSYEYMKEILGEREDVKLLKIGTPNPFPEKLAVDFLTGLSEVLVFEELDPVLEEKLTYICGKYHLNVTIRGKLTFDTVNAGENSVKLASEAVAAFLGETQKKKSELLQENIQPPLPVRPPVLCAGCPHRASFYAVKQAMKGQKANFSGDIGCYTLGNAKPLDMVDTCLCMGADVTMAQGLYRMDKESKNFAFIGDSTFFASGITGVVNAVYNEADMTLIVLDNSTTAMTGHQPHPGTGVTMMGDVVNKISIEKILTAIGVVKVTTVNPLELDKAIEVVKETAVVAGVKAIIMKSPCIAVSKPLAQVEVKTEDCINCKRCINELGCPAIVLKDGKPFIESSLCFGCGICTYVCPKNVIVKKGGASHE